MKLLWKCSWDNGYVSFVLGRSKREAVSVLRAELDEDVPEDWLEPVDHRASFFVTFTPCHEKHDDDAEAFPHWHSSDGLFSQGIERVLGEPPPLPKSLPPPLEPDPLEPTCQKCGHARFASVHHPDYNRPNKCQFEAAPPPAVGPDRPTSE